jgi:hypothetical protein
MTEVMILMVFVAMAFSFLARDEGLKDVTSLEAQTEALTAEVDRLNEQLVESSARIRALEQELAAKDRMLARLLNKDQSQLPNTVIVPKPDWDKLQAALAGAQKQLTEQQQDLGALLKKLADQGKGTGYPRCLVTAGFLLDVVVQPEGSMIVMPAWEPNAEDAARRLPGVPELVNAQGVSVEEFRRYARTLRKWGEDQSVPCRFHVRAEFRTQSVEVLVSRLKAVEESFYVKRSFMTGKQ